MDHYIQNREKLRVIAKYTMKELIGPNNNQI